MARRVDVTHSVDSFLAGGSEMADLIRSKDWSRTPLGPLAGWPQSLRTTVSLCLASNFPINIIWGEGHCQIYNDGYRVVCGEAHPEALGQSYRETWASAWPAIGAPFEDALTGATSFLENQRMFLTRNGYFEETFFTFSVSAIRGESGGIGGLFHPVTETTATMLAERRTRALRDLTARLGGADSVEALVAAAIDTLAKYEFDLPFLLVYELDEAADVYRLAGGFGIGGGAAEAAVLDPSEDAPWPLAAAMAARAPLLIDDLDTRFPGLAGGPYDEPPARAYALAIRVPGAARPPLLGFAGVSSRLPLDDDYRGVYDLLAAALSAALASVRAREDERRRSEALAAIDRAKTAFFSNVSHEFRTPLTLMLGPIEDALDDAATLPPAQRERLDLAYRNALRLRKLVNALLDFSRLEAGRIEARFEPLDLAAVTADLASNFRSACERAGLELVVDTPPISRPVAIDRDMWEKIVLNLISNAFKFTFEGQIAVSLSELDGQARLVVRDTGVGIAADHLPRIFDRFHRIEGQQGRTHEGTGIGLALVKELVALHGGTIEAQSTPGAGSAFVVSLPIGTESWSEGAADTAAGATVHATSFVEEALHWLPEEGTRAGAAGGAVADAAAARPRIVLADDNSDMRGYIRQILEQGGYHVDAVENGHLAVAAAHRTPRPDLVLTDVMMPGLDGFGVLEAIRSDPALDGMLVILLSARAGEDARIEGLAAGADDYLVKPFGSRELRARVDGAIALARQRNQAAAREAALQTEIAVAHGRSQLRQSETELAFALEAGRLGSWEVDLKRGTLVASAICRAVFGLPPDQPYVYEDLLERIDPWDRAMRETDIAQAIATHANIDLEYRINRPDGELAWVMIRGKPVYDDHGEPVGLAGVSLDITERKRSEERQRLLLDELNHRVKNTLATVQSIVMQTKRTADGTSAFAHDLEARVHALARAHELLTRTSWDGAMLRDVVDLTLAPYAADTEATHRVDIAGPRLRLSPNAAVTLNMAFHELATNAAKYGAFSAGDGSVRVSWSIDVDRLPPQVMLEWRESGGPSVLPPARRGFGSRLLERGLSRELDGSVRLEFDPEGVVCHMRFPATGKIEVLAP